MKMHNPRIGVIAENHLQAHLLVSTIREQGYDIVFNGGPHRLGDAWWELPADLWIVDLDDVNAWQHILDQLCDFVDVPVLYTDGLAPSQVSREHERWVKRLLVKVTECVGMPNPQAAIAARKKEAPTPLPLPVSVSAQNVDQSLTNIWVLGASLGGPAAVKDFLDKLPANLPVAFLLLQHIEASFVKALASVLCRNNSFACEVATPGTVLAHGKVLVATTEQALAFNAAGEVLPTSQLWRAPYCPNISQGLMAVVDNIDAQLGFVMFSGMGNDGSDVVPTLANKGIAIWTQSVETCVISSQVDEVLRTGLVDVSASPEMLAQHLLDHLADQQNKLSTGDKTSANN